MSYQLNQGGYVVRLSDMAQLPVQWVNGVAVELDEDSPAVADFRVWVTLGNVPLTADPVPVIAPQPTLQDVVAVLSQDPNVKAKLAAAAAATPATSIGVSAATIKPGG